MDKADNSNTEKGQSENKRGRWGAKLDYMLSMVGYCVGLGNIWRFPYLCMRNGGGAFLIPFIFFLLAAGLPLYFLEVSVGQFTGKSCFHVWEACPIFEGVGVGMFIVLFVITLYYNIIITWTIFYLGSSFFSPLPWADCENDWNTLKCFHDVSKMTSEHGANETMDDLYNTSVFSTMTYSITYHNNLTVPIVENMTKETTLGSTSEEEFWFNRVLVVSEGLHDIGGLNWRLTICFLVAWIVVCLCLIKGVKSLGKVVYITATLPYLLLIVILIKGLTLPGSTDGILFYIRPDFDKLASVQVWLEAGIQVFYSLGPAWGPLFTMASYNKFNNNCYRDSVILTLVSEGTSIFGGFAIFTIVGYMAHVAGKPVDKVVQAGPGLAFLVYPEALSLLPLPNVWAVLFFLTLFTVGLDSQFATLETCLTAVSDIFPRIRNHKALMSMISCVFFFLVGLLLCTGCGIYIFQLLDWYIAAFCLPLFGVIECLIFGWIYGADNLSRDIEMMIGRGVPIYMRILWCVITPLLLVMLLAFSINTYRPPMVGSYTYPAYGRAIGWIVAFLPIVPLPICAIRAIRRSKGDTVWKKLCSSLKPSERWRPVSNFECEKYKIENRSGDFKSTILRNICGKKSLDDQETVSDICLET
ncbi:sodium- and chloride-dependent glycine transporter 2-like [Saccostrea echinata]|uniref:sodium- and chloride-dependent glycine transporter 2-like n=1 Tax=Saccostrea echinata TaxID=191078 RepID=UPI002A7F16D3|nr:sodium- and chloride-dependent glycine transporter 2-like [Saccostrea echinata]